MVRGSFDAIAVANDLRFPSVDRERGDGWAYRYAATKKRSRESTESRFTRLGTVTIPVARS